MPLSLTRVAIRATEREESKAEESKASPSMIFRIFGKLIQNPGAATKPISRIVDEFLGIEIVAITMRVPKHAHF